MWLGKKTGSEIKTSTSCVCRGAQAGEILVIVNFQLKVNSGDFLHDTGITVNNAVLYTYYSDIIIHPKKATV